MAVGWAPLAVPPTVTVRVLRVCLWHWCDCSPLPGEWWPLLVMQCPIMPYLPHVLFEGDCGGTSRKMGQASELN